MSYQNYTEEILLCDTCKGSGLETHSELSDYHRGEYRDWNTICRKCNGEGRLLKVVRTETEITPYKNAEAAELIFKMLKETNDK